MQHITHLKEGEDFFMFWFIKNLTETLKYFTKWKVYMYML